MTKPSSPPDDNDVFAHNQLPLGKQSHYTDTYTPQLLCPIARQGSRDRLGLSAGELPFSGVDIWNAYEVSWLNSKGKPVVAMASFYFPCDSISIIESKSFKLYLNSLNQTLFDSVEQVADTLKTDLSQAAGADVGVVLLPANQWRECATTTLTGQCLDDLDIRVTHYHPDPALLLCSGGDDELIQQQLYSHLFRSLCPVTGQPDWASVHISYHGRPIDQPGLLAYLVGYRLHQDFHEQCVERIFLDISTQCKPLQLTVYARFVRRGGLDINPYRATCASAIPVFNGTAVQQNRLCRQ